LEIELLTQPTLNNGEAFSLGETITSILTSKKPKYKSATFIFGVLKPNAIDYLKPYLTEFLENGGTINFYIDSNKRTTSNNLINDLLNCGCNIFTFNSGDGITEFQYRGCFFEASKKADVFLTSGNLSLNGLFDSFNIITHLTYDTSSKENNEFLEFKKSVLNETFLAQFEKIESSTELYNEDSWSYSKNSGASIPSISEFTHKPTDETKSTSKSDLDSSILIEIDDNVDFFIPETTVKEPKKVEEKIIVPENNVKKIDTTPILDYPTETIYYNTDNALDIEDFLFESQPKKIRSKSQSIIHEINESVSEEETDTISSETPLKNKIIAKSADLSKTAIFMFEAAKITKRGVCAGEIKIPVYLRDLIANFWDWPLKYSVTGHAKIKSRICTFDIIDTASPDIKIKDTAVKLFQREDESSFSIHSKELEALNIAENDLIRLIKTQDVTDTYYTCEIVRADSKEYTIWEQFCTNEMKNSKRKYGIM